MYALNLEFSTLLQVLQEKCFCNSGIKKYLTFTFEHPKRKKLRIIGFSFKTICNVPVLKIEQP